MGIVAIEDTYPLLKYQADALYASQLGAQGGTNRLVFLGDSLTYGPTLPGLSLPNADVITGNVVRGDSFPTYAMLNSDGRWQMIANAGVGGDTSALMLARFQTDVVAAKAAAVVVCAGMNDGGTSVTLASYSANMTAIAVAARAANITPIFVTCPPSVAGGGSRRTLISLYNRWLSDYCAANDMALINIHDLLVDPATGGILAAYDAGDGVHWNYAGRQAVGKLVAQALTGYLPPNRAPLVSHTGSSIDMLAGAGLFLSDTAGIATGWSSYAAPTGTVCSRVTDSAVIGSMQRITATATASASAVSKAIASGFSVGDVLDISGIITTDGGILGGVQVLFTGSTSGVTSFKPAYVSQATRRGYFYGRFVIPTGTTSLTVLLQNNAGGTGVIDFAQVGVINRTVNGLV